VRAQAVPVACFDLDDALVTHLQRRRQLHVGTTA
jgi:hypothetical protein